MAYWLVPAEPFLSAYQDLVDGLAKRYDGPRFTPHLTIYSGPYDSKDPLQRIVEATAAVTLPPLQPSELFFTDNFKQSCVLRFSVSPELNAMTEQVTSLLTQPAPFSPDPHMSLFYGTLTEDQRAAVRSSLTLPGLTKFDTVCAVANLRSTKSKAEVEY